MQFAPRHHLITENAQPTLPGQRVGRAERALPPAHSPLGHTSLPHRLATIYPLPAVKVTLPPDPELRRFHRRDAAVRELAARFERGLTYVQWAIAAVGFPMLGWHVAGALL